MKHTVAFTTQLGWSVSYDQWRSLHCKTQSTYSLVSTLIWQTAL